MTEGLYVELYVRSLAPRGIQSRQRAVIERLTQLTDTGVVEGHRVLVCGRQIPAKRRDLVTEFGQFLHERIAVFSEWAERNGWSLDHAFSRRTVDSAITGETTDVLALPAMALAEYEGDALRFVAPVTSADAQWTVQERLDALLATGSPDSADRLPEARTTPPHRSTATH
jgi:hypothetical protein